MFDVCAVGHVTQDVIRVDGAVKKRMPGGAVYYASLALRRLGRTVAVVTKLAPEDAALLSEMRLEKIDVSCSNSAATTVFENLYDRAEPDRRIQRVTAVAEPFTPSDLGNLRARFFHLGPLTNRDLGPKMLKEASARGKVALDAQGLVRKIQGGQIRGVKPEGWAEWKAALARVCILKVNESEARILSGQSDPGLAAQQLALLGPREVIVTLGSKGSLIFHDRRCHLIDPVPPRHLVDPTGSGDTYMAGYLHRRLDSEDVERAARFASAVATLAVECSGPFQASTEEVEARLKGRG